MTKQIPSYLKLVTDKEQDPAVAVCEDLAALQTLCQAFEHATHWRLEYSAGPVPTENFDLMWSAPVDPGVGASPGHIRLVSTEPCLAERLPLEQVTPLAAAVGKIWGELLATRHALWQREAELATGIPLVVHADEELPTMGARLEGVLRGGAEAVGCHAAALYLLDADTTELKLRASWGLPRKRLTEPARPLRGALADLEALLGHAVVLTDRLLYDYWRVPEENFCACVCVPVSSPTMPLGTLWIFSHEQRDFTDAETNILEVVAGRLAADLERQVLVDEALQARDHTQQIVAAERSQQDQLPRVAPLIEGWEIAARAYHAGPVGGTFYDWFALDDGSLAVLAGDAMQRGVEGALTASALRAAARACGPERKPAHQLLEKANSILWTGSTGNACAGLFQGIVEPKAPGIEFAAAGPMRVLTLSSDGFTSLASPTTPLGLLEERTLLPQRRNLQPGEMLLAYGTTFMPDADEAILAALDQRLALALEPYLNLSPERLIDLLGEILQTYPALDPADRVLVLAKRRR